MKLGFAPKTKDGGLATRLAWITGLRLALLVALLVAIALLYLRGGLTRYPFSLRIVFATIAAGFALAGVYSTVLRSGKRLGELAYAQILLDQLTWTAIVYVSGGATSGATSFYALSCLVGAILIGLRGAAIAALSGLFVYSTLCIAFAMHWIHPPPDQAAAGYATLGSELVYPLLVNSLGIVVVSLLAGYLAERLRITGGALEAATQRAMAAERLAVLGGIAAGLAHEIRNPLGSIRGSIEMLRESTALSDEDKHLCDIIHRESGRLNNLVGDMLDLAKPRPAVPEVIDVAALAREVVALAARAERSPDVAVEYIGPTEPIGARCDGPQIRQVVWNLVRNAVQSSAPHTTVTVRVVTNPRNVVVRVEDRGTGITARDRERIFDAFYTTRSHGAGIGLAVVKRIIDEHAPVGAQIHVESPESGGAVFAVSLQRDTGVIRGSVQPNAPRNG